MLPEAIVGLHSRTLTRASIVEINANCIINVPSGYLKSYQDLL